MGNGKCPLSIGQFLGQNYSPYEVNEGYFRRFGIIFQHFVR